MKTLAPNKTKKIQRLLVANRGEIAIRVFRAANELGIQTVAIYSREDRFALHRFKADESYLVGEGKGPVEAYLSIDDVIQIAKDAKVDAIHPGYGFMSENPDFADACADAGIIFIGPSSDTMRSLGNKVAARAMAISADVAVVPASGPLPDDDAEITRIADEIGFPVMCKASWGGGGRGMRAIDDPDELLHLVDAARREAQAAFGNGEVYLEKLVRNARHVEVQILGDRHGNLVHLFERDCSVQRRHQKVVERAPSPYLDDARRAELCESALRLGRAASYVCAGTVEYLMDKDSGAFYFIEVNPRIQVEHTVTEQVTGVDLIKAQIHVSEGAVIGSDDCGVPVQDEIKLYGHALQCRVTTEDPENNFIPDYGRIKAYRGATGFGIRLDGGTAYSGALITRFYDSLLEKVTAWAPRPEEAVRRMDRALREFRIRGVSTNLVFLENVINHPQFRDAEYNTRFIDDTPELFHFPKRRDRATRILRFITDVTVNGNPEVLGRARPTATRDAPVPHDLPADVKPGTRQLLQEKGAEKFAQWMKDQQRILITDTTFRDAHQSLLATRMRTYDMVKIAPAYAQGLPELFSVESWGGATFDVAMRFLKEDPWQRLADMVEHMPNLLQQMLLRASNGVGYTNYPDNVVKFFVDRAADAGVDVFRVFDSLNWAENMRVAIDAVGNTGKLCEAAICYTGDLTDPAEDIYTLKYYVDLAKEMEKAGAHILGIKDMAGLCKPAAIRQLVTTLKGEVGLPIHFHTHDTSGAAAASVLSAIDAGIDAVDAAMDSMSGLTSQPNLGSIVAAVRHGERDPGLDPHALRVVSDYWEGVRHYYAGFESDIRCGTSDVYNHQMPGGQYTNLREQARSLGLDERWAEVSKAYAQVNDMFGNIVKVTPSSKVVGDMALFMVTSDLSPEDVMNPAKDISFPESVISFFRGDLGFPPGGFPKGLQDKVLKGEKPMTGRPGENMADQDLEAARTEAAKKTQRTTITDNDLASYLMYPQVFTDYANERRGYGDLAVLPTNVFFYGMDVGQEVSVDLEKGKTLVIRCLGIGEPNDKGETTVFFELNGQPRPMKVVDASSAPKVAPREKAQDGNANHVPAPMPGLVVSVSVAAGQSVETGDVLAAIEAMKMQTAIHADRDGVIKRVVSGAGTQVDAKDLLIEFED